MQGDVLLWFSAFRWVSVTWGFVHKVAGLSWVTAALTTCWWQSCTAPTWVGKMIFFLYFCIFKMGWKDLKRSTDCHRAWATTSRVTWAPWSPENGTSLPSKFSCQFKSSSVKPTHIVPLVEGSTFSGGNYEQSCSSKMPFGGASPLSRGDGGSTRIIALAQERSILPQSSLCFITFPPALMGTTK